MNISQRVLEVLKASEPWRPGEEQMYSPDQVFRAVEQVRLAVEQVRLETVSTLLGEPEQPKGKHRG